MPTLPSLPSLEVLISLVHVGRRAITPEHLEAVAHLGVYTDTCARECFRKLAREHRGHPRLVRALKAADAAGV